MDDVKELCKRIVIIDSGKLIFDNSFDQLIHKYADHKLITVTLNSPIVESLVSKYGFVKDFDELRFVVSVKKDETMNVAKTIMQDLPIIDLNIEEPRIEDVISEIFSGKDIS